METTRFGTRGLEGIRSGCPMSHSRRRHLRPSVSQTQKEKPGRPIPPPAMSRHPLQEQEENQHHGKEAESPEGVFTFQVGLETPLPAEKYHLPTEGRLPSLTEAGAAPGEDPPWESPSALRQHQHGPMRAPLAEDEPSKPKMPQRLRKWNSRWK